MHAPAPLRIHALGPADLAARLDAFERLLVDCVAAGASVGFLMPLPEGAARRFWSERILPALDGGGLVLLAAEKGGRLLGTVQLDCDTPANQPHRAEVRKLLVHPEARRQGIARALMQAIEAEAVRRRRSLLTLDTRTGDAAEPLYLSLGYVIGGTIPGYCRDTLSDRLDATTIMYRAIAPA